MNLDWREVVTEWLKTLDPNRADKPLYVLDSAEVADVVDLNGCYGVTGLSLCATCRPTLERLGLWRGYSQFIMILDVPRTAPESLLSFAAHEYVHCCQHAELVTRFNNLMGETTVAATLNQPYEHLIVNWERPRPWHDHGPDFGRLAIHLYHRARRLDLWVSLHDAWATNLYGLPDAKTFADALGDEPARLLYLPMVEVSQTPWPPEYKQFSESALREAEETFQHERNLVR